MRLSTEITKIIITLWHCVLSPVREVRMSFPRTDEVLRGWEVV